MRKCIELARSLFHEREYLKFIRPELNLGEKTKNDSYDEIKLGED